MRKDKLEYILYSILFIVIVFAFSYSSFAAGAFTCSEAGIQPGTLSKDREIEIGSSPYAYLRENGEEQGLYMWFYRINTDKESGITVFCLESEKPSSRTLSTCEEMSGGMAAGLSYIASQVGDINHLSGDEEEVVSLAIKLLATHHGFSAGTLTGRVGLSQGLPVFKETVAAIDSGRISDMTKEKVGDTKHVLYGRNANGVTKLNKAVTLYQGAKNATATPTSSGKVEGKTEKEEYDYDKDANKVKDQVIINITGASSALEVKEEDIKLSDDSFGWTLKDGSTATGTKVSLADLSFSGDIKTASNPTVVIKYSDTGGTSGGNPIRIVGDASRQSMVSFYNSGIMEVEIKIKDCQKDPEDCVDCEYKTKCCGNKVTFEMNKTCDDTWTNICTNGECDHPEKCKYNPVLASDSKYNADWKFDDSYNAELVYYHEICQEEIHLYYRSITDGYVGQYVMLEQVKTTPDEDTKSVIKQMCNIRFDQELYDVNRAIVEKNSEDYTDLLGGSSNGVAVGYRGEIRERNSERIKMSDGLFEMSMENTDFKAFVEEKDTKNTTLLITDLPAKVRNYNNAVGRMVPVAMTIVSPVTDYDSAKSANDTMNENINRITTEMEPFKQAVERAQAELDACISDQQSIQASNEQNGSNIQIPDCSGYQSALRDAEEALAPYELQLSKVSEQNGLLMKYTNAYISLVDTLAGYMNTIANQWVPWKEEQEKLQNGWTKAGEYKVEFTAKGEFEIPVRNSDQTVSTYVQTIDYITDIGEPNPPIPIINASSPALDRKGTPNCDVKVRMIAQRIIEYPKFDLIPKVDASIVMPGSGVTTNSPTLGTMESPEYSVAIPANAIAGTYKFYFTATVTNLITHKHAEQTCEEDFVISGPDICYYEGTPVNVTAICGNKNELSGQASIDAWNACYNEHCGCNHYCTFNGGTIDLDTVVPGGNFCSLSAKEKTKYRALNCTVCEYGSNNIEDLPDNPNTPLSDGKCYYCIDRDNKEHRCYPGETADDCYTRACALKTTSLSKTYNYRSVSNNDLFPTQTSTGDTGVGRYLGENWLSKKGRATREEIEEKGETIWDPDNKALQYSYTITASQMARIREYNRTKESFGGFNDFGLDCSKEITKVKFEGDDTIVDNPNLSGGDAKASKLTYCTSKFLAEGAANNYFTDNLEGRVRTWIGWCNVIESRNYCTAWKIGELE